jgi:Isochorismatase family
LFLPPRIQASGFGGTGLNEILRSKGIKNVAVAGFTSDVCVYATVLSAYDLGFHVYALREGMVGFFDGMSDQMVNLKRAPNWDTLLSCPGQASAQLREVAPGFSREREPGPRAIRRDVAARIFSGLLGPGSRGVYPRAAHRADPGARPGHEGRRAAGL